MALSAATVWEVRGGSGLGPGLDTNGGGFVAGATGTDWSQQNGPQYSVTNAVAAGTTTITSATAAFGTDVVGNIMYLQGGTGSLTAGWYQIVSRTNTTTIVVDRTVATGTGITLHIGGALATVTKLSAVMVASNKAFINGIFSPSATATFAQTCTPSHSVPPTQLIGYGTTRRDYGTAQIDLQTTGIIGISLTGAGFIVENININGGNFSLTVGFNASVTSPTYVSFNNCSAAFLVSIGFEINGGTIISNCTTSNTGIGIELLSSSLFLTKITQSVIISTTGAGIVSAGNVQISYCLISGCDTDGIQATGVNSIENCTIDSCINNGINFQATSLLETCYVRGNILSNSGSYGITSTTAGISAQPFFDGNAFYNNGSGNRNNMDDTTTNVIDGVSPYTNIFDVICSVNPYVNISVINYMLNDAATGGALLRGTLQGGPVISPYTNGIVAVISGTTFNYMDFGCYQHQDTLSTTVICKRDDLIETVTIID